MTLRLVLALALIGCTSAPAAMSTPGDSAPDKATSDETAPETTGTTTDAPADAPATAPAPETDLFGDAPLTTAPAASANSHHLRTITDRACLDCHGGSKATPDGIIDSILSKGAPQFVFGGTLRIGAAAAPGVEIRVVDDKGALVGAVTSDEDGNFWMKGTQAIANAKVGVRDAKGSALMHGALTSGNCASAGCHDTARRLTLR